MVQKKKLKEVEKEGSFRLNRSLLLIFISVCQLATEINVFSFPRC